MKHRIFTLFSTFALATTLFAQTQVNPYRPGITAEGITYYLPRTELRVTVVCERVTKFPGELKDYSQRYLRLNNVTQEPETTWTIKDVKITPFGVPDTSRVFSIPLRKKTVAPLASLTAGGVIMSINAEGEEDEVPAVEAINKKETSNLNPRNYMTEEILYAGSQAKQAQLIAAEIYDIRDSRSQLSKGQADNMPKDGQQLQLMLKQLDTQEAALMQLFAGTTETETKTYTLTYNPAKETEKDILFRFSSEFGLVNSDDLSGEPVYISIFDRKTLPAEQIDPKQKKLNAEAVRYVVPSTVDVNIFDSNKNKFATLTTPMAQFGRVEFLSSELFNKHITTQVTFNTITGSLKKITDAALGE